MLVLFVIANAVSYGVWADKSCQSVDMAVGVIIGGAFGKIVSSLVDDLIMPPIGWIIGGVNFSELKISLPTVEVAGEKLPAATINYGNFLQTCLDFFIVAFW